MDVSNLVLSQTEIRALNLLGQGIEPGIVASAVGVTEARISQLISDPLFSAKVAELRYVNLAKHSDRDREYDSGASSRRPETPPSPHRFPAPR